VGGAARPAALPVKYRIHFGELMHFGGSSTEDDASIARRVETVKSSIDALLERGLQERTGVFR